MYTPFSIEGKKILVTGASSGIGQQCAINFSKLGANVILLGRNEDRLKATMDEMEYRDNHLVLCYDLHDSEKIPEIIKQSVEKFGKLDGLLNCAGISSVTPLNAIKENKIKEFFDINVTSGFLLAKEFAKKNNHTEPSSIIFIASVMGVVGEKAKSLYSATKGALISMTRSLALELADKKIRVNCVSPGVIETSINRSFDYLADPLKRDETLKKHPLGIGIPKNISEPCAFLFSEGASWITGQNLVVDGGYSII